MQKGRVRLLISGYVQGVFYRATTRDVAVKLGLKGWVRNLPDGRVEAVFEGPVDKLEQMIGWCYKGPHGARVTNINKEWGEHTGEFNSFDVWFGW